MENVYGKNTAAALAEIYPQLYIVPCGEESEEQYRQTVRRGILPAVRKLDHFICDDGDSCVNTETPAGTVAVVTFVRREDFEMFYTIMGYKCVRTEIPPEIGAAILDGVINRTKINSHLEEYENTEKAAGRIPDRNAEFQRFTADKKNYLDALIVLSSGCYSNIPPERVGLSEEEWLKKSHEIRLAHECTHFICRRKYREQIEPVWDEIVADAAGIIYAFGRFDGDLERMFLGVSESGYTGGRLERYASDTDTDTLAKKVDKTIRGISEIYRKSGSSGAYEFAETLEKAQYDLWEQR